MQAALDPSLRHRTAPARPILEPEPAPVAPKTPADHSPYKAAPGLSSTFPRLSDTALVPYAGGFLKVPIDKYEEVAAQIGLDLDKVHAESAAALDASVDATFRSMEADRRARAFREAPPVLRNVGAGLSDFAMGAAETVGTAADALLGTDIGGWAHRERTLDAEARARAGQGFGGRVVQNAVSMGADLLSMRKFLPSGSAARWAAPWLFAAKSGTSTYQSARQDWNGGEGVSQGRAILAGALSAGIVGGISNLSSALGAGGWQEALFGKGGSGEVTATGVRELLRVAGIAGAQSIPEAECIALAEMANRALLDPKFGLTSRDVATSLLENAATVALVGALGNASRNLLSRDATGHTPHDWAKELEPFARDLSKSQGIPYRRAFEAMKGAARHSGVPVDPADPSTGARYLAALANELAPELAVRNPQVAASLYRSNTALFDELLSGKASRSAFRKAGFDRLDGDTRDAFLEAMRNAREAVHAAGARPAAPSDAISGASDASSPDAAPLGIAGPTSTPEPSSGPVPPAPYGAEVVSGIASRAKQPTPAGQIPFVTPLHPDERAAMARERGTELPAPGGDPGPFPSVQPGGEHGRFIGTEGGIVPEDRMLPPRPGGPRPHLVSPQEFAARNEARKARIEERGELPRPRLVSAEELASRKIGRRGVKRSPGPVDPRVHGVQPDGLTPRQARELRDRAVDDWHQREVEDTPEELAAQAHLEQASDAVPDAETQETQLPVEPPKESSKTKLGRKGATKKPAPRQRDFISEEEEREREAEHQRILQKQTEPDKYGITPVPGVDYYAPLDDNVWTPAARNRYEQELVKVGGKSPEEAVRLVDFIVDAPSELEFWHRYAQVFPPLGDMAERVRFGAIKAGHRRLHPEAHEPRQIVDADFDGLLDRYSKKDFVRKLLDDGAPLSELASELKKDAGIGGGTYYLPDGRIGTSHHDGKGITVQSGFGEGAFKKELKWNDFARRLVERHRGTPLLDLADASKKTDQAEQKESTAHSTSSDDSAAPDTDLTDVNFSEDRDALRRNVEHSYRLAKEEGEARRERILAAWWRDVRGEASGPFDELTLKQHPRPHFDVPKPDVEANRARHENAQRRQEIADRMNLLLEKIEDANRTVGPDEFLDALDEIQRLNGEFHGLLDEARKEAPVEPDKPEPETEAEPEAHKPGWTGRADYAERREARIEGLRSAASAHREASGDAVRRAHDAVDGIPLGQPNIKGRLTSAYSLQERAMRKAIDEGRKADDLAARADAAERNHAISSDDPEAIDKLRDKLASLERHQQFMKDVNAAARLKNTARGDERLRELGVSDKTIAEIRAAPPGEVVFPSFELSNNNANIRRIRERIASLERAASEAPPDGWTFDGGEVEPNVEKNRLQIRFDERAPGDVVDGLKANGFRWSPSERAWQRQLTRNAISAARRLFPSVPASESRDEPPVAEETSAGLDARFPGWNDNSKTTSGADNTQITGTAATYRRIGEHLRKTGQSPRILDASSGKGEGTKVLRDMGFDISDSEPYPGDKREPPTYSKLNYEDAPDEAFDLVISNAVLNVVPDDWRDSTLAAMSRKVAPGGSMIVNVRDAREVASIPNHVEIDDPSEVLVTQPDGSPRHYQKGFTQSELEEYIRDHLGDGWSVERATPANSGLPSGSRAIVATRTDHPFAALEPNKKRLEILPTLDYYKTSGARSVAHAVKEGNPVAIDIAAKEMARHVGPGQTLVPIPSHTGEATYTLDLANAIAKLSGAKVWNGLTGRPRERMYDLKKDGKADVDADFFGYSVAPGLPDGDLVLVDNVVATGTTARYAGEAIGSYKVLAYATAYAPQELKALGAPVTPENVQELRQMEFTWSESGGTPADAFPTPGIGRRGHTKKAKGPQFTVEQRKLAYKALDPDYAAAHPEAAEIARRMLDAGLPVSSVLDDLYSGFPLHWPVVGCTVQKPEDVAALCDLVRNPFAETMKVLYTDRHGEVLAARVVAIGTVDSTLCHPRDVFRHIPDGATGFFLSHNHPSGNPSPSPNDIAVSRNCMDVARRLGLAFYDHVITDTTRFHSFRENRTMDLGAGLLRKARKNARTLPWKNAPDPWEAVPAADRIEFNSPDQLQGVAGILSSHDPDSSYLIHLDRKHHIIAVEKLDADDTSVLRLVSRSISRIGTASATILIRGNKLSFDIWHHVKRLGELYRIPLLDAINAETGESAHRLVGEAWDDPEPPDVADNDGHSVHESGVPYDTVSRGDIEALYRSLWPDIPLVPRGMKKMPRNSLGDFYRAENCIRLRRLGDIDTLSYALGGMLWDQNNLATAFPENVRAELAELGRTLWPDPMNPPDHGFEREGFGGFLHGWLAGDDMGNVAPKALSEFERFLAGREDIAGRLFVMDRAYHDFLNQSPEQRVNASIDGRSSVLSPRLVRPWLKWRRKDAADALRKAGTAVSRAVESAFFDDLSFLEKAVEDAGIDLDIHNVPGERGTEEYQKEVSRRILQNPYLLATFFQSRAGEFSTQCILSNVPTTLIGGARDTEETHQDGLGPILWRLKGKTADGRELNVNDFLAYAVARRGLSRYFPEGRDMPFSEEDALETARKLECPEYAEALKGFTDYAHRVLSFLTDSGLLTKGEFNDIVAANPVYVPLMRVFAERARGGGGTVGSGLHRLGRRGSLRDIRNPVDSIVKQTLQIVSAAQRGRVAKALVDLYDHEMSRDPESKRLANLMREVDPPREEFRTTGRDVVRALARHLETDEQFDALDKFAEEFWNAHLSLFRDRPGFTHDDATRTLSIVAGGRRRYFEIQSPELFRYLSPSKPSKAVDLATRLLDSVMMPMRLGSTVLNPRFNLVTNLLRDTQTAAVNMDNGNFMPVIDSIRGMRQAAADAEADIFRQMGMEFSSNYGHFEKTTKRLAAAASESNRWLRMYRQGVFTTIASVLARPEIGPRIKFFLNTRNKYMDLTGGDEDAASLMGGLAGADGTENFRRGGWLSKALSHMALFFNADAQGVDRELRAFGLKKGKPWEENLGGSHPRARRMGRAALRGVLSLTLPHILAYAMREAFCDEETRRRYHELPDYEKYSFLHIPTGTRNFARIPVPFGVGFVFGSLPTAIMEQATGHDPDAIAHWWHTYLASKPVQVSIGIEKDDIHQNLRNLSAIAPEVDLLRGKNWWGGKVMDAQTERLPTTEQVDFHTSVLSASLAPVFGQSPAKFEYWANQHLGGFYGMVGTSLTNIAHPGRMCAHGDLSTLPVVGALFTPRNRNDLESGFFSRAEELKSKDATKTMTLDEFAEQIAVEETKDRLSDFYRRKAAARSAVKGGRIDYTALKREEDEVNDRVREIIREHNRHVREDDLRDKAVATAVSRIGNPATKEDTVDALASMLLKDGIPLDDARSALLRELRKKHGRLPPSTKKQCARLVQAYARAASLRHLEGEAPVADGELAPAIVWEVSP